MCVDSKAQETVGDVYCPTCRTEKCLYLSTNKTDNFIVCRKCKACSHVLYIPLRDQKVTIVFIRSDGTLWLHQS